MNRAADHVALQFDDAGQQAQAATLGMWAFLATEVLFFGPLFAAYLATRLHHPDAWAEASGHTDVLLGTIETVVLLTSSLTVALALRAGQLGRPRRSAALLGATVALGLAFLVLHGFEYLHEWQEGLVPVLRFGYDGPHAHGVELFYYLYYIMTGLHAVHVLVGIGVLGTMAVLAWRGRVGCGYDTPLELAGLYWHLVDIVWIFLYPMFYLVGRA